ERDQTQSASRLMDDWVAPPVDKGSENAPSAKARENGLHPRQIECEEFGVRHFARRHGEFAMRATGDMTQDRDVIGLVGEYEAGGIVAFGESSENPVCRAAADDAVKPELEDVAEFGDR